MENMITTEIETSRGFRQLHVQPHGPSPDHSGACRPKQAALLVGSWLHACGAKLEQAGPSPFGAKSPSADLCCVAILLGPHAPGGVKQCWVWGPESMEGTSTMTETYSATCKLHPQVPSTSTHKGTKLHLGLFLLGMPAAVFCSRKEGIVEYSPAARPKKLDGTDSTPHAPKRGQQLQISQGSNSHKLYMSTSHTLLVLLHQARSHRVPRRPHDPGIRNPESSNLPILVKPHIRVLPKARDIPRQR